MNEREPREKARRRSRTTYVQSASSPFLLCCAAMQGALGLPVLLPLPLHPHHHPQRRTKQARLLCASGREGRVRVGGRGGGRFFATNRSRVDPRQAQATQTPHTNAWWRVRDGRSLAALAERVCWYPRVCGAPSSKPLHGTCPGPASGQPRPLTPRRSAPGGACAKGTG